MKSNVLFLLFLLTQTLSAQTFTEISDTPFDGVRNGASAFSDIDGDGDNDLLIIGQDSSFLRSTKLYTNDGDGNFSEVMDTPFENVRSGSITFLDVDGDGDNDLLITGDNISFERVAKLYNNDGNGNFTEVSNTPFDGVWFSSVAFSDIDSDGDNDLVIAGENNNTEKTAKLYTNDGSGNFTQEVNASFEGVVFASIAFSDVDGDNDDDLFLMGQNGSFDQIAKLYTNDSGSFTEVMNLSFLGLELGSIAFSDIDGDNDNDLLITGRDSAEVHTTKLYTNDGSGTFMEVVDIPFDNVLASAIAFSDVDLDGDNDLLISGFNDSQERIAKLYTNEDGNFTVLTNTPFDGVSFGSVSFADVDGDTDMDVLITGQNSSEVTAKLFINGVLSSLEDEITIKSKLDFTPFPNPAISTMLYLDYNSTAMGNLTIRVYNTNGILLKEQNEFALIGQQVFSIDIASLPQGNYYVEIDNNEKRGVMKFVVY